MQKDRRLRRLLAVMLAVLGSACRRDPTPSAGERSSTGASSALPAVAETASAMPSTSDGDEPRVEAHDGTAGSLARAVEAQADDARRDAGAPQAGCSGPVLGLVRAALDPRCAIGDRDWSSLTSRAADAGAEGVLRQEARREGERLVVAVVNRGNAPVDVPLRFEPGRADLPAVSVLAEDAQHAVFELAPPKLEDEVDGGAAAVPTRSPPSRGRGPKFDAGWLDAPAVAHVYSARIRLPPGGVAQARFAVDAHVVKRLDNGCHERDAAACVPARLPQGHYVLYIGQLLVGVDVGPPGRIAWDGP